MGESCIIVVNNSLVFDYEYWKILNIIFFVKKVLNFKYIKFLYCLFLVYKGYDMG